MYKLIIGILSIAILGPVALFSGVGVSEAKILEAAPASLAALPAEPVYQENIETQAEPAFVIPEEVSARSAELRAFVDQVYTGQLGVITGVHVDGVFSLPVLQQPANDPGFISSTEGTVTEFRMARDYGSIGMLAHNYLAGAVFNQLESGQTIFLVYGDGQFVLYTVTKIERYQALSPNSPYSDFIKLDGSGQQVSATELFYQTYGQEDALVLQTCLEKDGNQTWGRLFVTAVPQYALPDLTAVVVPQ